jgi:hypothetical protein
MAIERRTGDRFIYQRLHYGASRHGACDQPAPTTQDQDEKPHSSNTRYSACAVALKPPPQLADPQNDLIWTVADVTELDLATAHIGGYARSWARGPATFCRRRDLQLQRVGSSASSRACL